MCSRYTAIHDEHLLPNYLAFALIAACKISCVDSHQMNRLQSWRKQFLCTKHNQVLLEIGRAHVELQSLMRISYAVFCLNKKTEHNIHHTDKHNTMHIQQSINTL